MSLRDIKTTELGPISQLLKRKPPEIEFEWLVITLCSAVASNLKVEKTMLCCFLFFQTQHRFPHIPDLIHYIIFLS